MGEWHWYSQYFTYLPSCVYFPSLFSSNMQKLHRQSWCVSHLDRNKKRPSPLSAKRNCESAFMRSPGPESSWLWSSVRLRVSNWPLAMEGGEISSLNIEILMQARFGNHQSTLILSDHWKVVVICFQITPDDFYNYLYFWLWKLLNKSYRKYKKNLENTEMDDGELLPFSHLPKTTLVI